MKIQDYIVRPLAEAALVLTDDERRLGCMFVDFGAETTTVAIFKNDAPAYLVTLPMGSRNITIDLTSLNYIEERAEEIKRISGNAMPAEGPRRPEMCIRDRTTPSSAKATNISGVSTSSSSSCR